jgi:serine/threonine protein phosphatase PrpC
MQIPAIRQRIGTRSHQCDAARANLLGAHAAYVLLDGIGSDPDVQRWTRTTASRLAREASQHGAEYALTTARARAEADQEQAGRYVELPSACAVVATVSNGTLTVAWSGDVRAYLLPEIGSALRLTTDHNMRQVLLDGGRAPGPYDRNIVTSCIGHPDPDTPAGLATVPAVGRLVLASDGAYEPIEDAGYELSDYTRIGPVGAVASLLVRTAVRLAGKRADNATVLIADLS